MEHRAIHHVGRYMRLNGIEVIRSRKFKRIADSDHAFNIMQNLLQQDFTASRPDQKWTVGMSCVRARESWVYLAVIPDLFSRHVVGWAIRNHIKQDLAARVLDLAIVIRRPPPGCVHHPDRGTQYWPQGSETQLRKHGFRVAIRGKGNCCHNSATESIVNSLKAEPVWCHNWQTRREPGNARGVYSNGFYNPRRKRSAPAGNPPWPSTRTPPETSTCPEQNRYRSISTPLWREA